jgi:Tfp pilus assembly protein PilO
VIDTTGSYPNLASFFDKVGNFARIININNLTVKSLKRPKENRTIQANYIATTFVFLDQSKEE